jgi:hypothetical protein
MTTLLIIGEPAQPTPAGEDTRSGACPGPEFGGIMAVTRALLSSLLAGVCVAAGGCATRVEGTAQPVDTLGPTRTTTATPTPALVPAAGIADKLLKHDELGSIVGDTDMKDNANLTKSELWTPGFVPEECAERIMVAQAMNYGDQMAFVGNQATGARGQVASQVISVWTDREKPRQIVRANAELTWKACPDNSPFTFDSGHGVNHWTTGTITANEDTSRISTTAQRQEPPPRTCAHVMAAQANVVVETSVCGDGDTLAAANQIADRILAKVPQ